MHVFITLDNFKLCSYSYYVAALYSQLLINIFWLAIAIAIGIHSDILCSYDIYSYTDDHMLKT